jgi:hypothetical protein
MANFEIKTDLKNLDRLIEETKKVKRLKCNVGVDETKHYDNGTSVAEVATYLEYGWSQVATWRQRTYILAHSGIDVKRGTLTMPPRPIFGYTSQTCKGKWLKAGSKLLKNYVFNPYETAFRALNTLGQMAVQDIKITINTNGKGTFPARSPLTLALYGELLEKHQPKGDSKKLKKRNITKKNTSNTSKALVYSKKLLNSIAHEIIEE